MNLYIQKDGRWDGPFSAKQIQMFLERQLIKLDTPCRIGSSERVRNVEHFLSPAMQNQIPSVGTSNTVDGLLVVGLLLAGAGLVGAIYFLTGYDTSVGVEGNLRVNNLGLMHNRQIGIIVSLAGIFLGVIIALLSRRR